MTEAASRASAVAGDDINVEVAHVFPQTWIMRIAVGQGSFAERRRRDESRALPLIFVFRPDHDVEVRVVTSRQMAPLFGKPLLKQSFAFHGP